MQRIIPCFLAFLASAFIASTAGETRAALITPADWSIGWNRGDPNTTYQEWSWYTSPTGINNPNVANQNPHWAAPGDSDVTDSSGASFVTGTGNIYSFTAITDIDVVIPNAGTAGLETTVVMQLRTSGREPKYGSMRIGGVTPTWIGELDRISLGGAAPFGGDQVDGWALFHLPHADDFTIEFNSWNISMSLDIVVVDTILTPAGSGFYPVDYQGISLNLGDVSHDGLVNVTDLGIVGGNWGDGDGELRELGDADQDGFVTVTDLGVVGSTWGIDYNLTALEEGLGTAHSVPMPRAFMLGGAVMLTAGLRRTRRTCPIRR